MNKDQIKGRIKQAEGKAKQVAGNLVGNETMEAKGQIKKHQGRIQAKIGDAKESLKHAIDAA